MAIVFTKLPKRGDAVIGKLATGEVLFVRQEELVGASEIDTSVYEIIGVVVKRRHKEVLIAYKENASKVWCNRYSNVLTSAVLASILDGESHTITFRVYTGSSAYTDYTLTVTETTAEGLITTLNTAFADNTNYPLFVSQDWCARSDGSNGVTCEWNYTLNGNPSCKAFFDGGDTDKFAANLMPDVVALANIRRRHGGTGGEGALSSWYRAITYFHQDLSSTSYNPSSDVTSIKRSYPVCLPAYLGTSQYQSDHCALLRQTYGEGETGWLKFMESCMPVNPTDFGNIGQTDSLARTKVLAEKTYTSLTKTDASMCPAAKYCYDTATTCIPAGNWFLGTVRDIADLLEDVKYNSHGDRTSDPINATLNKLGGSAISNGSFFWSCCRYSAGGAWYANGGYGFFRSYGMYNGIVSVPLSLLKLA